MFYEVAKVPGLTEGELENMKTLCMLDVNASFRRQWIPYGNLLPVEQFDKHDMTLQLIANKVR